MFATFLQAWYWFKDESAECFPQNLRRNTCVSWFGRRFCLDQSSGGQSFVAGVEPFVWKMWRRKTFWRPFSPTTILSWWSTPEPTWSASPGN